MCLYIKSGCKIEIAKEPIEVKKLLEIHRFLWFIKFWEAPIMRTYHRFNKVLKSVQHLEAIDSKGKTFKMINEGFHTYTIDTDLVVNSKFLRYAVIPKGAEYCLGDDNTVVSNKLIVFSSKEKFDRYIKKNKKE